MRTGLFLYRLATRLVAPAIPFLARQRVAKGRDDAATLPQRFARELPPRPTGPLLWLHGASVGESKLLLLLADRLQAQRPDLTILHTCQTLTGAGLIAADIATKPNRLYTPSPIDTPAIARRFAAHWTPDLAVFAEGEIWPNLLREVRAHGGRTALINARMTRRSLKGWARWPQTAKAVIGAFDLIAAADADTAAALQAHAPHTLALPSNLKTALPPPDAAPAEVAALRAAIGARPVLLAASTHAPEEALVLEALAQITPRPFLILAPRHPERGDTTANLCHARGHTVSRRSQTTAITEQTDILLADTMGEMGLWIRLADTIYLGGGHASGVGGHNPLEAIRLGKPVLSGPDVFNFTAMMNDLAAADALRFVPDAAALARAFPAAFPTAETLQQLAARADAPLEALMHHLAPLLPPKGNPHA